MTAMRRPRPNGKSNKGEGGQTGLCAGLGAVLFDEIHACDRHGKRRQGHILCRGAQWKRGRWRFTGGSSLNLQEPLEIFGLDRRRAS